MTIVTVDRAQLQALGRDAQEVLSMLKRANVYVASAAIGTADDETRRLALAFVRESAALVRRVEGVK